MRDAEHEELLQGGLSRFPVESFVLMRTAGVDADAALQALGFSLAQLTYVERAVVSLSPWDPDAAARLLDA